jgi:acyl-CoA synthetase (AMP-forming)/AMP-acid ligase II
MFTWRRQTMKTPTIEIPKFDIPHFDYYWQYVDYWSGVDPDFPSLREGSRTVTAHEFKEKAEQLAQAFLWLGVKKGDRIVSILPTGIDFVLTLVAAGSVGAILVPMDVKFRTKDLERFLSHAKPSLILSVTGVKDFNTVEKLKGLGGQFTGIAKVLVGSSEFGHSFEELITRKFGLEKELEQRRRSLTTADGSLIIFTGGTTGVPKAALLNNLNTTFMSYIEYGFFRRALSQVGIEGRIKSLAALPPSHVGGTVELIGMPLVGGFEIILMEDWSPYKVLEVTSNEKIPWIGGVPTMYAILLSLPDLDKFDLSSVKLAALGGERVSLELAQGIKEMIAPVIVSGYGSTEAGSAVSYTEPGDDLKWIDEGYVGKPFPTVKIKVIDDSGKGVGPGEVGEVIIGGPLVIPNYYNMPEEDEAGFTPDGWCRTGDLGYQTKDGGIYIKGRIKQIIRVGSYTVLPTEVEEAAMQFRNVGLAAAIGVPDKIYGEVIWLYIAPVWGTTVDTDGLMAYLTENLAKFKVPRKIIIKDDIPITRIGKSDRTKLKNEVMQTLSENG